MADLISRAAAIEAVYHKPSHKMAIEVLKEVPAVDAVPVEWLKEYQLENQRQGNYDMVGAIEVTMWDWEKEQVVEPKEDA